MQPVMGRLEVSAASSLQTDHNQPLRFRFLVKNFRFSPIHPKMEPVAIGSLDPPAAIFAQHLVPAHVFSFVSHFLMMFRCLINNELRCYRNIN